MLKIGVLLLSLLAVFGTPNAAAQSHRFEAGAQVASALLREFDRSDTGAGARFSWRPIELIGTDAEINVYPRDFPDGLPFTSGRVEGFFGATIGPRLNRFRPFAKLRPGFVAFHKAPRPIVCILIYPPPLPCALGPGRTLFALDVGGGVDVFTTRRTRIRIDVGDRAVKYPPAFDHARKAHATPFIGHGVRLAIGAGVGF